jgi:hypothetical protein
MAARGKTMALSIAGVGILVLLAGAVVLREPILEEWHIHKLRTGDPEEARRAAEALGKMGSVRAVPALLEAPGRSRRKSSPAGAGRVVSVAKLPPGLEPSDELHPALPFPAARGTEWPALSIAILGASSDPGSKVIWDAPTARVILSVNASSGTEETIEALGWAGAALREIGDRAVPALERAARDDHLDAGARAFASLVLARRALANPRIILEAEGAEVSVEQRASEPLPGSRGSVYLSAGDITGGRVKVWITPTTGAPLIEGHSLAEGEEVSFSLAGKAYVLRLEDLRNRLIGTDHAVFRIREEGK